MKRKLDFDTDMQDVYCWLRGNSNAASNELKHKLDSLWWAHKEAVDRNEVLIRVLIAAAAKGFAVEGMPVTSEPLVT